MNAPEMNDPEEFEQMISEAGALAAYMARHGDVIPDDESQLREDLFRAVSEAKSGYSPKKYRDLMSAYAKATAVTYGEHGINGRTILDTQRRNPKVTWSLISTSRRPMIIGFLLFVAALSLEVLAGRETSSTETADSGLGRFYAFLMPAVWGGIGSCIFLAKRISDALSAMSYERLRQRGTYSRIFLGCILGFVTVSVFLPELGEKGAGAGSAVAGKAVLLAFVTGLGVKPAYAAFESLSEELARRFGNTADSDRDPGRS